jgi:NAD(P)-dependent dehydrogenase (short-subunit alcohol dehydrogenase family)
VTRVALVTGGGRGIGANVARALAADGWEVLVGARTRREVDAVAAEIDGRAVTLDVGEADSVDAAVAAAGAVELLVANAGIGTVEPPAWEASPEEWWRVFEVNVRGAYLCCRAVIPPMLERGTGRIVLVGSGAAYLPGSANSAYAASKAALCRFGEVLARQLEGRIPVFVISPGLVRTRMTETMFADDAPWTPPELAPALVVKLASGRYDALAGRYLHAEHDDVDDLLDRIDELRERDLNAIRLQR